MSDSSVEQGVGSELPVEVSMVTEISSETVEELLQPHSTAVNDDLNIDNAQSNNIITQPM